ncbi:Na/Pi cotransporter family protein [Belnapia sp. F-4-1]|uniref:Na/Pi cotransporter family protein n=1 Tax=Belnapia sp. F-4-1 TaxID=1545443 RepID=UPI00068A56E6|nr:Na/Pi symporter [Belnapia sp. F-4-1]
MRHMLLPRSALGLALCLLGGAAWAQDGGSRPEVDWVELAMGFLGGLVLFLFGVSQLAEGLREAAGERVKSLLGRATNGPVRGLLTGVAATTLLDSSSVTIILLIGLVDAGLMRFAQALPVILGSNIGTTVSSQIFALGVDEYAPVIMLAGLLLRALSSRDDFKAWGTALLGIGLVLFGLHVLSDAVEPLRDHSVVLDWIKSMSTPLLGVLAGAAFTLLIQSSSATLGVVIVMAGQGLIELPTGLAIMLGAEIGTCSDTLVATVGRSRHAVRAGVFHLLFNVVSVTIGVLLIDWLAAFARFTSGEVPNQIANAHVAFNVAGAAVFLPFSTRIAALLARAIPDRDEPDSIGQTGLMSRPAK